MENPALIHFIAQIQGNLALAQVLITRNGNEFNLRHVEDRDAAPDALRLVKCNEARLLAQSTATGEFRPLKSAPTLQRGWRMLAQNNLELETALSGLYPGAVADWFAARAANPPVTNYREYVNRQSGMYRITAMLDDSQAAEVIRAVCDVQFCLKRRLWMVAGLQPDGVAEKSIIPCLEPCAVLMESARKALRASQASSESSVP